MTARGNTILDLLVCVCVCVCVYSFENSNYFVADFNNEEKKINIGFNLVIL